MDKYQAEYIKNIKDEAIPPEDRLIYLIALEYDMLLCMDKPEDFPYCRTFGMTLVSDNKCAIVKMGKLVFSDVGQAVAYNDYFLKKEMMFFSTEINSKMINNMEVETHVVDYNQLLEKWSK